MLYIHTFVDLPISDIDVGANVEVTSNSNRRYMKYYGKLVLELGLLFKNLNEAIQTPNRTRMLRIMKLMMAIFKAKSNSSKYADELLRFLIMQQCLLPPMEAELVFHSLFVNTNGKPNGHVPVDMIMEYIVNTEKRHIKHMGSNKTENNIIKMSKSLAGICNIVKHFDIASDVIERKKSHKVASSTSDELMIVAGLRSIRPFRMVQNEPSWLKKLPLGSLLNQLIGSKYNSWLWTRGQYLMKKLDN